VRLDQAAEVVETVVGQREWGVRGSVRRHCRYPVQVVSIVTSNSGLRYHERFFSRLAPLGSWREISLGLKGTIGRGGDGKGPDRPGSVVGGEVCGICRKDTLGSLHVLFELGHQALCLLPVAQGGVAHRLVSAEWPSYDRIFVVPR
jgi:hypothetical protein